MPGDPANIRLPSISEWMPDEPQLTRPKQYYSVQGQVTHIHAGHSPRLPDARPFPLRARTDSTASSAGLPSRNLPITAQLPPSPAYNNSYGSHTARSQEKPHTAARCLPPHQQIRVGDVDHDAMDVDAPHSARRSVKGSAPSSYSVLHHDPHSGKLESITSNSAYGRGSRSPTSPTRSGMVNGSDPIFRVPPLLKVGPHAERPQQGSGSGSTLSAMDVDQPPHMIISFPTAPISPAAGRYTSTDRSENRDSGVDDSSAHGGDTGKKHICPICSSRFNRPSSLRIHINTHTGETPFRCPWPDCGREFNVNSNMRRHYRNHSSPGSSRNGREGTQKRRRRRTIAPGATEYPPDIPAPSCRALRQLQRSVPHAPGYQGDSSLSFAPPISTLSVREGSFASGGTSEESEDGDSYGPCDSDHIDELSEDDFRGPPRLIRTASLKIVSSSTASLSPVSSPSLSASSSTSAYSRASASLSPPPGPRSRPRPSYPFLMSKQEPAFEGRILIRGNKHELV